MLILQDVLQTLTHFTNVKKSITTLALALTFAAASAQSSDCMVQENAQPAAGAKLISTTIVGDEKIQKWLVPEGMDDEFSVKYQINISRMISTYDNNSAEVVGLRNFLNELHADKSKSIARVNICGYASPDGGYAANQRLATARAVDCRQFINTQFNMSQYAGSTKGVVKSWNDTEEAVNESQMPSKSAVIGIVTSASPTEVIEQRLKSMPSSWGYMIRNILPPMRCVEIEVVYTGWKCVETRTPIAPEVVETTYYIIFTPRTHDVYSYTNPYAAPMDYKGCKEYRGRGKRAEMSKYKFKSRRHKEKFKGDMDRYRRERKPKFYFR